eukprot:749795-Hanusia_phi.AAC.14
MARQAQSRMKLLERIQGENVELDYDDPYLRLEFPAAQTLPPPCISVMNVSFGYEEGKLLYEEARAAQSSWAIGQAAVGEPDSVEEARKYLGRFGLSGDLATRPIKTLSGGEDEDLRGGGEKSDMI